MSWLDVADGGGLWVVGGGGSHRERDTYPVLPDTAMSSPYVADARGGGGVEGALSRARDIPRLTGYRSKLTRRC